MDRIGGTMKPYGTRYQIVMVDDGTDDSTAEVAEVAAGQQPIRFLGVSATAVSGARVATGLLAAMRSRGTSR